MDTSVNTLPASKNLHGNNYKILHDIKSLGCTQKGLIAATYRTYLDLTEVRKFEDVSYHYLNELDLIYLKALKNKEETEDQIVVPMLASKKLSFKQIEDYQDVFKSESVNLAICDSAQSDLIAPCTARKVLNKK